MNISIATLLVQDGLTNGLLYALLALSILLVFLVTKVFWIPAGEFVVFGALTMAQLGMQQIPGTLWLLLVAGGAAALSRTWEAWRNSTWVGWRLSVVLSIAYPLTIWALLGWLAPMQLPIWIRAIVTVAVVAPISPLLYTSVFKPIIEASVLSKLIVAVALHTVLVGAALLFFGAEGMRSAPFASGRIDFGFVQISRQLLLVLGVSALLMVGLWAFFEWTLWGKALRATAINRHGAKLVGVPTESAGLIAFAIAGLIGAVSGVLIGPITTLYFDSGFLLGIKGFIGVVIAAMLSFPVAVLGALLVGLLDAFASFFASSMRDVIVFSALIPILIWRSISTTHTEVDEE